MKKFEVTVRGQNFLIRKGNQVRKNSFYAARFVEANDYSAATEKAMDSFRSELKDSVVNDKSNPPALKVVEINEVYYFQDKISVGDMTLSGHGFVWDEPWDEEKSVSSVNTFKRRWMTLRNKILEKDYHVHSICIHFTNALYPVAILFMFLFLLAGKTSFQQTYFYIMVLATFSVPFSYLTGVVEWRRRYQGAWIEIFLAKIRYGLVLLIIGGCCTLWHYLFPDVLTEGGILGLFYILLNISILLPLIYLGHLGGVIVYEGLD